MQQLVSIFGLHGAILQDAQRKRCPSEHFNRAFSISSDLPKPQEKQMVCTVPHAGHIPCLQIRSESIHSMWKKQKSLSKDSALELQNIFLGKCCKYSFKSTSSLQLITTFRLSNSELRFFPSYHQGLFR